MTNVNAAYKTLARCGTEQRSIEPCGNVQRHKIVTTPNVQTRLLQSGWLLF